MACKTTPQALDLSTEAKFVHTLGRKFKQRCNNSIFNKFCIALHWGERKKREEEEVHSKSQAKANELQNEKKWWTKTAVQVKLL